MQQLGVRQRQPIPLSAALESLFPCFPSNGPFLCAGGRQERLVSYREHENERKVYFGSRDRLVLQSFHSREHLPLLLYSFTVYPSYLWRDLQGQREELRILSRSLTCRFVLQEDAAVSQLESGTRKPEDSCSNAALSSRIVTEQQNWVRSRENSCRQDCVTQAGTGQQPNNTCSGTCRVQREVTSDSLEVKPRVRLITRTPPHFSPLPLDVSAPSSPLPPPSNFLLSPRLDRVSDADHYEAPMAPRRMKPSSVLCQCHRGAILGLMGPLQHQDLCGTSG